MGVGTSASNRSAPHDDIDGSYCQAPASDLLLAGALLYEREAVHDAAPLGVVERPEHVGVLGEQLPRLAAAVQRLADGRRVGAGRRRVAHAHGDDLGGEDRVVEGHERGAEVGVLRLRPAELQRAVQRAEERRIPDGEAAIGPVPVHLERVDVVGRARRAEHGRAVAALPHGLRDHRVRASGVAEGVADVDLGVGHHDLVGVALPGDPVRRGHAEAVADLRLGPRRPRAVREQDEPAVDARERHALHPDRAAPSPRS